MGSFGSALRDASPEGLPEAVARKGTRGEGDRGRQPEGLCAVLECRAVFVFGPGRGPGPAHAGQKRRCYYDGPVLLWGRLDVGGHDPPPPPRPHVAVSAV